MNSMTYTVRYKKNSENKNKKEEELTKIYSRSL